MNLGKFIQYHLYNKIFSTESQCGTDLKRRRRYTFTGLASFINADEGGQDALSSNQMLLGVQVGTDPR